MRVLVCGGRNYRNKRKVYRALSQLRDTYTDEFTVIQGGAKGADYLAKEWALSTDDVNMEEYPADWDKHGKKAGYIRNAQMLEEGKPDIVLAFPGGPGTKMMRNLTRSKGIDLVIFQDSGRPQVHVGKDVK